MEPRRYKVMYGGRGSGKSWAAARALVLQAYLEPLRVLCARETQKSINESVHELLKVQIAALGLDTEFVVQEQRILGRNGSEFAFAGLRQQGITNIKSFEGFDRVWVEEAQVVTRRSWEVLIPTIRKPGSEIWVTFNPELDTDETYKQGPRSRRLPEHLGRRMPPDRRWRYLRPRNAACRVAGAHRQGSV